MTFRYSAKVREMLLVCSLFFKFLKASGLFRKFAERFSHSMSYPEVRQICQKFPKLLENKLNFSRSSNYLLEFCQPSGNFSRRLLLVRLLCRKFPEHLGNSFEFSKVS